EPLPGVAVTIKKSSKATATDMEGKYSIEVAQGMTLQFSLMGYKAQTVTVGQSNTINITLSERSESLEEVVLLGSRSKPRSITESPVPVDVFDIEESSIVMPQTNLNQMLNAIVPS